MTLCIGFDPNDMRRDTANTGGIIRVERRDARGPDEHNTFIVVGRLLPGTHRRNFQGSARYFQRGELGLGLEWELAHLWAPRFGDEAAAGIMWAPKEMNQTFQNHAVEPWITDLRDSAPPRSVEITAVATSWDNDVLASRYNWSGFKGVEFLKQVTYEVSDCPSGMQGPISGVRLLGSSVSMTLDAPRPGILPRVVKLETETLQSRPTAVQL
ncbi:MAG: polymorphic toxin type 4 domain-containing protein [Gammaproteobacteria bacterium]|nr:polymorphic toxin type 4 domain-containing protein [Gammaproteobacteria bacterium]